MNLKCEIHSEHELLLVCPNCESKFCKMCLSTQLFNLFKKDIQLELEDLTKKMKANSNLNQDILKFNSVMNIEMKKHKEFLIKSIEDDVSKLPAKDPFSFLSQKKIKMKELKGTLISLRQEQNKVDKLCNTWKKRYAAAIFRKKQIEAADSENNEAFRKSDFSSISKKREVFLFELNKMKNSFYINQEFNKMSGKLQKLMKLIHFDSFIQKLPKQLKLTEDTVTNLHLHYLLSTRNEYRGYHITEKKIEKAVIPNFNVPLYSSSLELNASIYSIGGWLNKKFFSETHRIDIEDLSIQRLSDMSIPKGAHSVVLVENDSIYTIGGFNEDGYLDVCERYDIDTDKWKQMPSLNEKKIQVSVCKFNDTILYAFGGFYMINFSDAYYQITDSKFSEGFTREYEITKSELREVPGQVGFGSSFAHYKPPELINLSGEASNSYFKADKNYTVKQTLSTSLRKFCSSKIEMFNTKTSENWETIHVQKNSPWKQFCGLTSVQIGPDDILLFGGGRIRILARHNQVQNDLLYTVWDTAVFGESPFIFHPSQKKIEKFDQDLKISSYRPKSSPILYKSKLYFTSETFIFQYNLKRDKLLKIPVEEWEFEENNKDQCNLRIQLFQ